jgi:cytoskeletal protein CcmA (bactofilin family)
MMFTKKPDAPINEAPKAMPSPMPVNGTRPPVLGSSYASAGAVGATSPSIIGTDLSVTGNLQSKGEIQIEGQIQGDLQAARIVVGPNAKITGGIVADDVEVQGTVHGSIRGMRVTLKSNSRVEGDVFHQSLAIEQGAYFEGKSRRSENPKENKTDIPGAATG